MNDTSSTKLFQASVYVLQGSLLFLSNSVILVAVVKFEALRDLKEFMIVAALALADALAGIGTLGAGLYRIPVILSGQADHPASKKECFLTPHAIFWCLAVPLSAFMLLAVSFDRLLCVSRPLKYIGYGRKYAYIMIVTIYGYSIGQFVVFASRAWRKTNNTGTRFCSLKSAVEPLDLTVYSYGMTLASLLSIVLYCFVVVIYTKRKAKVDVLDSSTKASLSRQRRLTRTLGVSCACTFVFFALPTVFAISSLWIPQLDYAEVGPWCGILMNLNPLCNLGIFFRKQKEIRVAIIALFKGKQMPQNIEMWKTHKKHTLAQEK